jgi:hypothetical protein
MSGTHTEQRSLFVHSVRSALRFRKKCEHSLGLPTFPQQLWPQSSVPNSRGRSLYAERNQHIGPSQLAYCGCDIIGSILYMAQFPLRHWQTEKVIINKCASDDV